MPESSQSSAAPVPDRPRARERGRMRRRLRRQRRMREALLLDLGAIVFELHRQGRREPELLQAKAAELKAVDDEVRALADALDTGEGMMQLVAAGIAGSCENCGSLLSTDARYCDACGAAVLPALAESAPPPPPMRRPRDEGPALETGEHPAQEDEDEDEDEALEYEPMEHEPPGDEPPEDEPVEREPVTEERWRTVPEAPWLRSGRGD